MQIPTCLPRSRLTGWWERASNRLDRVTQKSRCLAVRLPKEDLRPWPILNVSSRSAGQGLALLFRGARATNSFPIFETKTERP